MHPLLPVRERPNCQILWPFWGQPARLPRSCYGGFLNGCVRAKALAAIREQIGAVEDEVPPDDAPIPEQLQEEEQEDDDWVPETDYPCLKCGARLMKWVALIPATRGWQAYSRLVSRTLPRRVQERLRAESEAASAAFHQQLAAQHPGRPP